MYHAYRCDGRRAAGTERQKEELASALIAAEQANAAKSDFFPHEP